jgi:hypothetical protein
VGVRTTITIQFIISLRILGIEFQRIPRLRLPHQLPHLLRIKFPLGRLVIALQQRPNTVYYGTRTAQVLRVVFGTEDIGGLELQVGESDFGDGAGDGRDVALALQGCEADSCAYKLAFGGWMGGLGPRKPEPPKTTIRGGGMG